MTLPTCKNCMHNKKTRYSSKSCDLLSPTHLTEADSSDHLSLDTIHLNSEDCTVQSGSPI